MKLKYLFIFFCCMCISNNANKSLNESLIIFLDISSSTSEYKRDGHNLIKVYLETIIKSLRFKSKVNAYLIHANTQSIAPFINVEFPEDPKDKRRSDRIKVFSMMDSIRKVIPQKYDSLRSTYQNDNAVYSTCIKATINHIKQFRKSLNSNYRIVVVYLSDMEEACTQQVPNDPSKILTDTKIYCILPRIPIGNDSDPSILKLENEWKPFFQLNGANPDSIEIISYLPDRFNNEFKYRR